MEFGYWIGWCGVFWGLLVAPPQLIKILKTGKTEGISLLTYLFLTCALICYLWHSFYIHSVVFQVAQGVALVVNGAILCLLVKSKICYNDSMMNKFNRDEFLGLHWREKQPIRKIAKLWNVSSRQVYEWTHSQQIPIRRGKYTFPKKLLHKWYWEDEFSIQEIADSLGVNRNYIPRILFNAGVKLRTKSENMKLAIKKGISIHHLKGMAHPNWKGGRVITDAGYILIKNPNHPRADKRGYVYEHILILEQKLGHSLPRGWVGHHLNGVKSDNRPKNLVAMPRKKHSLLIPAMAKRIQELEAQIKGQGMLC